jgi:7,8-dihydropterin-6-yl-methyl-4-(beta-D-ribofuranosyl)aminobenzene 5'-phosphate synthase
MTVTVLTENRACGSAECAHGLSLHLETGSRSILFDFGPEGDLLLRNARTLGIDLARVDLAILSHGHDDHSGGLEAFLRVNDHAPVYLHRLAFAPHFSQRREGLKCISPDPELLERYGTRLHLTNDVFSPGAGLTLFSDPEDSDLSPGSNGTLYEQAGDSLVPDRFLHEQDLLIREDEKLFLFGGCAHRGIVNILRRGEALAGRAPDAVFSGFHLTNPGLKRDEPEDFVRRVGGALERFPSRYFTGHCTGEGPYRILKEILGDRLQYMGCGLRFTL